MGKLSGVACRLSCVVGLMLSGSVAAEEKSRAPASSDDRPFAIALVDPSGRPVQGARVGNGREQWDYPDSYQEKGWNGTLIRWNIGGRRLPPAISDKDGTVTLPYRRVFRSGRGRRPLYAWHQPTGLVGLHMLAHDADSRSIRITLQPACHVFGEVHSSGLKEAQVPLLEARAALHWEQDNASVLHHSSSEGRFEFLLPVGDYVLRVTGWGRGAGGPGSGGLPLNAHEHAFTVKQGQRSLDLGVVDLKPTALGKLVGKPAPGLQQIRDWKNTTPIKLVDLKGKVVLLEFWGHWCGPCVGNMPFLFDVYDRYAKHGLVVLAIHDNRVGSIEEMNKKLEGVRARMWEGRDLPFPVALDSGDGHGATHEAYHISRWPTSLLVDRNGTLAHVFRSGPSWDVIERILDIKKEE